MEWDFKDGLPINTQIIDIMTARIAAGVYRPGEKLPSVRDLAVDAGVNPNTMQRAMAEMERKGLVFSLRTSGRFITEDMRILGELRDQLARRYFGEFRMKLKDLGMDDGEIQDFVRKQLEIR